MMSGKITLVRGIQFYPYFLFIFPNFRVYVVKNMFMYCVETFNDLLLGEIFFTKSGALGSVDWIFIIGAPSGG